jgi:hypothetical protein
MKLIAKLCFFILSKRSQNHFYNILGLIAISVLIGFAAMAVLVIFFSFVYLIATAFSIVTKFVVNSLLAQVWQSIVIFSVTALIVILIEIRKIAG